MIPRHGRPPRPGIVYRHRPGAYAVLIRDGKILLTRQVTGDIDELQLPGGGIDPGESPLPALIRELREETGYSAILTRHVGAFRDFTWMSDYGFHAAKLCNLYLGRPGRRVGPPTEAGHSPLWLPLHQGIAKLASEGSRRLLTARFG